MRKAYLWLSNLLYLILRPILLIKMPLNALFRGWYLHFHDSCAPYEANNEKLTHRFLDVIHRNWHLGFTSFGGPPVHFRIFYQKFVEDQRGIIPWIDEQTVRDLYRNSKASQRAVIMLTFFIDDFSIKSYLLFVRLYQGQAVQRCYSASFSSMPVFYRLFLPS